MSMKRNYYCLVAGLPDIKIDDAKLSFTELDFKNELRDELHKNDFKLIEDLFLNYDNENFLFLLSDESRGEFNEKGNYSKAFFQEEIREPENLLGYFKTFLLAYKEKTPIYKNMSWQNQLLSLYYGYVLKIKNTFLHNWFRMELDLKNIQTAQLCRKFSLSVKDNIVGDPEDPVNEQLLKSNARDFGLAQDIPFIERLIYLAENADILEKEKEIDVYKWNYLDEHVFFHYFTIEKIISFLIKLRIIERWLHLDKKTGKELFNRLISDMEKSYELPEEFSLRK
jgi:hypothetical protein